MWSKKTSASRAVSKEPAMTYDAQPKASHFIGGDYVEDTAGDPIEVIYAATGETIARLHAATPAIVEKALASAKAAEADWAAMGGTGRGRVLRRAADILRERNRELSCWRRSIPASRCPRPWWPTPRRAPTRWSISAGSPAA
jgi:delta 1-pyrroline-5-carboxylate dehydrogenase